MSTKTFKTNFLFGIHLLSIIATWMIPFLIPWKIGVAVYTAVMIQFAIWGKCLMNEHHGLDESNGRIFYTEVLEKIGFQPNPYWVKTIVRQWLYPILAMVSVLWQVMLGHPPLWF
jgi:hypothetical protein